MPFDNVAVAVVVVAAGMLKFPFYSQVVVVVTVVVVVKSGAVWGMSSVRYLTMRMSSNLQRRAVFAVLLWNSVSECCQIGTTANDNGCEGL